MSEVTTPNPSLRKGLAIATLAMSLPTLWMIFTDGKSSPSGSYTLPMALMFALLGLRQLIFDDDLLSPFWRRGVAILFFAVSALTLARFFY